MMPRMPASERVPEPRLAPDQGPLDLLALGEITNEARERRRVPRSGRDDDELHRELAAARLDRRQLDASLQDRTLAGGEVTRETGTMRLAEMGRHDELGERATDGLEARAAEGLLGRGVEVRDAPAGVHGDDTVERGLHDRGASVAGANERLERALALELLGHLLEAQRHLSGAAVPVGQRKQREPGPDAGRIRRERRVPARRARWIVSPREARRARAQGVLALDRTRAEEVTEAAVREQGAAVGRANLKGHGCILEHPLGRQAQGIGVRAGRGQHADLKGVRRR